MAGITIELEGRSFEVAPFKIGDLRKAAPFVDRMNDLIGEAQAAKIEGKAPTLGNAMDLMRASIEILAIALIKVDPEMTADAIEASVDMTYVGSLQIAAKALLASSGLAPKGEATAPSPPAEAGAGASESSLAESSAS